MSRRRPYGETMRRRIVCSVAPLKAECPQGSRSGQGPRVPALAKLRDPVVA